MIVRCDICGAEIPRYRQRKHYFCCVEHQNQWVRKHVDFAALSRLHKAKNLTELNGIRNRLCRVGNRGKPNSRKARAAAEQYLGRKLRRGEVVHHKNGNAEDNDPKNLQIMTDRKHKQLHMALAIKKLKGGVGNE